MNRSFIFSITILLLVISSYHCIAQTDSVLKVRSDAKQVYDTAKVAMVDTNLFELTRINNAAEALIETDNFIIERLYTHSTHTNDSLRSQLFHLQEINIANEKLIQQTQLKMFIWAAAGFICIVMFGIMAFIYFKNRSFLVKLTAQNADQLNVLAEYRTKMDELNQELSIAKNETGALMSSLSRHRIDTIKKDGTQED